MIKNRRDISLLLCLVLLFSWFFPEIGSEAATSSELEQSIKEKESAITEAQEQKK